MRKSYFFNSLCALIVLIGFGHGLKAQCSASFIHSSWPNGVMGFTSTSAPVNSLTAYHWNFGDGSTQSGVGYNFMGAAHSYTANGTYIVLLTINGSAPTCSSTALDTVVVTNAIPPGNCNLNAGWSNSLGGPGTMNFTNNSTGTVSGSTYFWDYGDGNTSTGINGTNTYSANGNYTVMLIVNNNSSPACIDTAMNPVTITTATNCNLSAGFNISQGTNGNVSFISTSTGTMNGYFYNWNFGPAGTASGQNVNKNFANGTYTAVLTVSNSSVVPTCTSSATQTFAVSSNTCFLQADFYYNQGSNGLVSFVDTSSGTNSGTIYSWNFGNGNVSNSAGNPSTTYLNGGTYVVTFSLTDGQNNSCTSVIAKTINITSVPCSANPNFTLVYGGSPGYWLAVPAYPWNVAGAQWNWGDNSSSNSLYTSHTYSTTGNYNICLTVTATCGSTASTCATYSVYKSKGMAIYQVNVIQPDLVDIDQTEPVGLTKQQAGNLSLSIYPNPAGNQVALQVVGLENSSATLTIRDAIGRKVLQLQQSSHRSQIAEVIDFSEQPAGLYFITLKSGSQSATKKVVITK